MRLVFILLAIALCLQACGLKGPLVLPDGSTPRLPSATGQITPAPVLTPAAPDK